MKKLNILWTSGDETTSENMLFMYAINAKTRKWWDEITILTWGSSQNLCVSNERIKTQIEIAIHNGINICACKGCSDRLGITEELQLLGINVTHTGTTLTEMLQSDDKFMTI